MKNTKIIAMLTAFSMAASLLTPIGTLLPEHKAEKSYAAELKTKNRVGNTVNMNNGKVYSNTPTNPTGKQVLDTDDKIRTSKIAYQTIGMTFTRCVKGTKTPIKSEWIAMDYDPNSLQDIARGDAYSNSYFGYSIEDMKAKIGAYNPSWLEDIESGETVWVKVDCIMITYNYNFKDVGRQASGIAILNGTHNVRYIFNPGNDKPAVYDNVEGTPGKTKNDLLSAYGWASKKSILTHFDHYILFSGKEDVEPQEFADGPDDGFEVKSGKEVPEWHVWNTSDQFDLSKGIPTDEDITNGVGADTWYGNYTLRWHKGVKTYSLNYEYTATLKYKELVTEDSNGNPVTPYYVVRTATYPEAQADREYTWNNIERKYKSYYFSNMNFYELADINVMNDCYPGDIIDHDFPGDSIEMDALINGEANPSEIEDWTFKKEGTHVKWPDAHPETVHRDCGTAGGDESTYEEAVSRAKTLIEQAKLHDKRVIYDDEITDEDYIKGVVSRNDFLKIDGVTYLNGAPELYDVTATTTFNNATKLYYGVDTTKQVEADKYKLLPSGKDDNVYKFVEDEETVTIPRTVANRKLVRFQQRIVV